MTQKIISVILATSIILSGNVVYAEDNATEVTTETTTEQSNNSEKLNEMMDQMENDFGKDTNIYNDSDLTISGGNHGGTTMTLSDFQELINSDSKTLSIDNDTMFNYMKNSLDAGEDISLSSAFSNSTGIEIPSNLMYDLSDCGITGNLDASNINLQYADLSTNLSDTYNSASLDLSKNTINATTLFNNTYGDLVNKLQVTEATLPTDFDFSSLSSQNQTAINEAYNSAFSNSDYNSIKNKVSTSSVFEEASKGLTMPDLLDLETLNSLTTDYNSEIEKQWSETALSGKSDTWATYQGNLSNQQDYESSGVAEAQEGVKNKITETESSNADARYNASTTKGNYIGKKIDDWGGYDWVDPFYNWLHGGDNQERSDERTGRNNEKTTEETTEEANEALKIYKGNYIK
ncbi:MAG: hypothetical protein K6G11_03220 [Lachnospiraceae bacterium]|nr:hypothetical protein [Lachnospiraceae bacterium]